MSGTAVDEKTTDATSTSSSSSSSRLPILNDSRPEPEARDLIPKRPEPLFVAGHSVLGEQASPEAGFAVDQRRACRTLGVSQATVRYRARRCCDQRLHGLLRELAKKRRRLGYRRLAAMLQRLGERMNVKRSYREEQLHLRRWRHCKRIPRPRVARCCRAAVPISAGGWIL